MRTRRSVKRHQFCSLTAPRNKADAGAGALDKARDTEGGNSNMALQSKALMRLLMSSDRSWWQTNDAYHAYTDQERVHREIVAHRGLATQYIPSAEKKKKKKRKRKKREKEDICEVHDNDVRR